MDDSGAWLEKGGKKITVTLLNCGCDEALPAAVVQLAKRLLIKSSAANVDEV